jgi:hypothetical protein
MAQRWRIDLLPDGRVRLLHHDGVVPLVAPLGPLHVQRLTDVAFDEARQGWRVRPLTTAPVPPETFVRRDAAVAAEVAAIQALQDSYGSI